MTMITSSAAASLLRSSEGTSDASACAGRCGHEAGPTASMDAASMDVAPVDAAPVDATRTAICPQVQALEGRISILQQTVAALVDRLDSPRAEAPTALAEVLAALKALDERSTRIEALTRGLAEGRGPAAASGGDGDHGAVQRQLAEVVRRQDALALETRRIHEFLQSAIRRPPSAQAGAGQNGALPKGAMPAGASPPVAAPQPQPQAVPPAPQPVASQSPPLATPRSAASEDVPPLIGRMEDALQRISVAVRTRHSEDAPNAAPSTSTRRSA